MQFRTGFCIFFQSNFLFRLTSAYSINCQKQLSIFVWFAQKNKCPRVNKHIFAL